MGRVLPYEKDAMANKPLPKDLDVVDSYVYLALKHLYLAYKKKLCSREEASKEKATILYNMSEGKSKLAFLDRESATLRDRISEASERYAENPTIENADKLYAAFYNISDDWRIKGMKNT